MPASLSTSSGGRLNALATPRQNSTPGRFCCDAIIDTVEGTTPAARARSLLFQPLLSISLVNQVEKFVAIDNQSIPQNAVARAIIIVSIVTNLEQHDKLSLEKQTVPP